MNDNSFDFLYQNVEKLKGIGPKKASYFKNLNINTVIDIFYNLPTRSIDRTQDIDFKNLEKGQTITTLVKVKKHHFPFNPKLPYVIECEKGSLIGITGSFKIDSWKYKNTGEDRYKPVVRVDRLNLLSSRKESDNNQYSNSNNSSEIPF